MQQVSHGPASSHCPLPAAAAATLLPPSLLRFGLESALLSALAASLHTSVTDLLAPPPSTSSSSSSAATPPPQLVRINGLLSPPVTADVAADAAAAAAAAAALVASGYTAIKVKVARRPDPAADAAVLAAVRAAVGPHVGLRADANRGWAGLEAAAAFGAAAAAAGVGLEYVEEPTADPRDMAAFYRATGGWGRVCACVCGGGLYAPAQIKRQ